MDPSQNPESTAPLSADQVIASLQEQLAQQQQLLLSLTSSQQSNQPHSLPTRQHFDWTPPDELLQLLPELSQDLFSQQLSDEQKRAIIDGYPAMQGIRYTAPATLPAAASRFNRSQAKEDASLRQLQYQLTAVFRPLDILAHELFLLGLPQDQVTRLFVILRDARTLLMHANGAINQTRNNLALRTINLTFSVDNENITYTMPTALFQSAVSQQAAAQRAIRDARPRFQPRSLSNQPSTGIGNAGQFFPRRGQSGGNDWSQNRRPNNNNHNNSRNYQQHNTNQPRRSFHNTNAANHNNPATQ